MAIITGQTTITPKLVAVTPYEIYLSQVRGVYEGIKQTQAGMDYLPPHMGGPLGQRAAIQEAAVLERIDFEVY